MPITPSEVAWTWPDTEQAKWEVITPVYQQFYERWRQSDGSEFKKTFPYKLSLGQVSLPFRADITLGDQILITEAHNSLFYRILGIRMRSYGARGAVITGQPGIGSSL